METKDNVRATDRAREVIDRLWAQRKFTRLNEMSRKTQDAALDFADAVEAEARAASAEGDPYRALEMIQRHHAAFLAQLDRATGWSDA